MTNMPEEELKQGKLEQPDKQEAYREGHATTFGGIMAGALTGAAVGGTTLGPAGATIGAVTGGAVGAAAERTMHLDDEGEQGTPGETTWVPPSVEEGADRSAYLTSRVRGPAEESSAADEFQRDDM